MSITITTRVDKETLKQIDEFSKYRQMDRATMLRNLIAEGLEKEKLERTLRLYKERKVSLAKAAEILNADLWTMLEMIKREGLYLDYSKEELEEDMRGFK